MADIVCEYCKLLCKTKYVLKAHLIRSKKCLKIRGLSLNNNFNCKGCHSIFATNSNLTIHQDSCKDFATLKIKEDFEEKIEILKRQNDELKISSEQSLEELRLSTEKTIIELKQSHEKSIFDLVQLHEKEKSSIEKSLEYIYKLHEKEKAFLQQQNEIIHKSYENLSNNMDAIEFEETNENL